ncbi:MAG: type IV secretion system protein [Candidatus Accumulibacter sp.]|jgi:type IV secretory pathway TrbL component|nr:type IV secretion system protein [Accumulibacter sp.]
MRRHALLFAVAVAALLLFSLDAHAQLGTHDVFDTVLERYQAATGTWAAYMRGRATFLFWALATISMVWTFGLMLLRKADLGEFFAEFIRFIMFTGFFWALLYKAPELPDMLIESFRKMGNAAAGLGEDAAMSAAAGAAGSMALSGLKALAGGEGGSGMFPAMSLHPLAKRTNAGHHRREACKAAPQILRCGIGRL